MVEPTEHTHESNPDALIRLRADARVRAAAGVVAEATQNILAEVVGSIPIEDHVVLSERRLRRAVYSAKRRPGRL